MKKIIKVKALDNYTLEILFENNVKKIFDMKPYLKKGVFKELQDVAYFRSFINKRYFIEWPNEQDLSSDTLYYG